MLFDLESSNEISLLAAAILLGGVEGGDGRFGEEATSVGVGSGGCITIGKLLPSSPKKENDSNFTQKNFFINWDSEIKATKKARCRCLWVWQVVGVVAL